MTTIYDSQRQVVPLERELARGGEAAVHLVQGQPDVVAKIYLKPRPGYDRKLKLMIANPPTDPNRSSRHVSIAWPRDTLHDAKGEVVGYLMDYVRNAVPLLNVFNPRLRASTLPGFDRRYLHRAAANLAAAMDALHTVGYVIGDVNESNILVTDTALVTIIDTDSFQVPDHGGMYFCLVGKPEYMAPELHGKNLKRSVREPEHDTFALSILIFQMLMEGSHPFRSSWTGSGHPPSLEEKIRQGWFPYANPAPPKIAPPPNLSLTVLAPEIETLLHRCFVDGHKQPARRPTATEWKQALEGAASKLVSCRNGHYYANHQRHCPICNAKPAGQQTALPPAKPPIQPTQPTQAARSGQPPASASSTPPATSRSRSMPWGWLAVVGIVMFLWRWSDLSHMFYPVTIDEWKNELARRNKTFGQCEGYWCYMQPGTYHIGGWKDDSQEENDTEADITLPKFWIAKHPVTVQQYRAFMDAGGYSTEKWWTKNGWEWKQTYDYSKGRKQPDWWNSSNFNQPDQPVVGITWFEAMAFANWLNEQLKGSLPDGYTIRLPTEAEYEAACAYDGPQGQRRSYPWGNQNPTADRAIFSESEQNRRQHTEPVGGRQNGAAANGAHDMAGNVWEWTMSGWEDFPQQSGKVVDNFTSGDRVVFRGSAWYSFDINYLRCGYRNWNNADPSYNDTGGARLLLGSSRP